MLGRGQKGLILALSRCVHRVDTDLMQDEIPPPRIKKQHLIFHLDFLPLLFALIFIFFPAVLVDLDVCEIIFQPVWEAVNAG